MREASRRRTVTDTDSYAFPISTNNANEGTTAAEIIMKNHILPLLFMVGILAMMPIKANGQIYFYKCAQSVNDNGIRSAQNITKYLTFSGSIIYESDAQGNPKKGGLMGTDMIQYQYGGMSNGNYIYYAIYTTHYGWQTSQSISNSEYLLVSSDRSLINHRRNAFGQTDIYERTTAQKEADSLPSIIY